jgi:hypothetical protein
VIALGLQCDTPGCLRIPQSVNGDEVVVAQDGKGERPEVFGGLQFRRLRRQEEQMQAVKSA